MKDQDQCLERLRLGDEKAFREIYLYYFPKLYYFVLEYVKVNDLAENIVQDTMFNLWNKREQLNEGTNLSAYLFSVAKNNCLYRLREMRYQRKLYVDSDLEEVEFRISTEALNSLDTSSLACSDIEDIIQKTMNELPEQCRKIFSLSRFEDKKNKEIADALQITVKAVERQITKALKIFRANLKDYLQLLLLLLAQKFMN